MESRDFEQRTALATALQQHLLTLDGTQATKASALGISQPRISDLLRHRVEKFSLDALMSLTEKAGLRLDVITQEVDLLPTPGLRLTDRGIRGASPFPVEPSELARLGPIEASKLFLKLLRCDVFSVGLTPKHVVLSLDINKKDGGIDAKVDEAPISSGLLALGNTRFQIKTGSAFKPWERSCLIKELFGKTTAKPTRKLLGSAVRECLENDGTYSLIVFGYDLLPDQHTRAVDELISLFKEVGFKNPRVELLGQGQIAGEIERYPSIYRDLFGFANDSLLTVRTWKSQSQMQQPLMLGEQQKALITEIQSILNNNSSTFIRLVGEPGIGKTRLTLEAVSDENIAPTVIYVPTGEEFQESRLFKELIQSEIHYHLTIVIDDCDDRDRTSIWAAIKGKPSIRLITIDQGSARDTDSEVRTLDCPPLENDQVQEILETYLGKRHDLRNWADLCDGSPRVAHAIGQNLKENPDDVLRQPSSVPIWDRFVIGYTDTDSRAANEFRTVLRYLALFTKFGFESPVSEEGRFIAELVRRADPQITFARFQEIVHHFRGRRILQGSHTLFLVPKALQIHLWLEYWTIYGRDFDFQNFMGEVPTSMRDWFLRLFTYAHKPEPARAVVRSILEPDGPFSDKELVESEVGPRLLRYLAEADPEGTLSCIERTYGHWGLERLQSWSTGRHDIVRALEYIAVWENCYEAATGILINMALSENSDYSNNAAGTLKGLFAIGIGWAATQAPPATRFEVLKRLIVSRDDARFRLGLKLAKEWLSTYGGYRAVGPEFQGLRPTIEFWRPKTYGEVFDAWRNLWRLLRKETEGADSHRKNEIAKVFLDSTDGLIQTEELTQEITTTLFELANDDEIEKKPVVSLVIRLLKYRSDGLSESSVASLHELDEILTGHTLWDRISRYVLNSNWDEDFTFDGEDETESDLPAKRTKDLALEIMIDEETFSTYVGRLLGASGHRLSTLGVECGKLAVNVDYDGILIAPIEDSSLGLNAEFLGGYLAGLRDVDDDRWEKLLKVLLDSDDSRAFGIRAIAFSGFSDNVVLKLIKLYSSGDIGANAFDRFAFRLPSSDVSEQNFLSVVDALLNKPSPSSASVVVELIHEYYIEAEKASEMPRERTLAALKSATKEEQDKNPMRKFYWGRLAKAYIKRFSADSLEILEAILTSKSLSTYNNAETVKIANDIVRSDPVGAWETISPLLEDEGSRRYDILHWLGHTFGGGKNESVPVIFLPPESVISWVKKDPEQRVSRAMQLLPKTLDPERGGLLTSRFIEEFGQERNVAGGLVGHFWAGSWTGPESVKLEKDRDNARKWLGSTNSQSVRSWLSHFITSMTKSIREAKIREEREF